MHWFWFSSTGMVSCSYCLSHRSRYYSRTYIQWVLSSIECSEMGCEKNGRKCQEFQWERKSNNRTSQNRHESVAQIHRVSRQIFEYTWTNDIHFSDYNCQDIMLIYHRSLHSESISLPFSTSLVCSFFPIQSRFNRLLFLEWRLAWWLSDDFKWYYLSIRQWSTAVSHRWKWISSKRKG